MREDHPFFKNKPKFQAKALTKKIAAVEMAGVRQVWSDSSIIDGLTPQRLASILKAAEQGSHHEQLELAEVMEERDLHYGSVLRTRALKVQGIEPTVEAYSDHPDDVKLANAVRDLIRLPAFDALLDDLTDALGKAYSAVRIDWTGGKLWEPSYTWCDPRWFVWDRKTGRELRLIDEADPVNGIALDKHRWITHVPRIKSGLPSRSGLARLAAIAYMCKSWTMKDWMAFADVYGLPLRIGKYGTSATPDDIATLKTAIANIASDAGAVVPESMAIEFIETNRGSSGGNIVFEKLANYWDAQVSKAILGHTGSADSTPGSLGGEDQASELSLDYKKSDAKQLAATINQYLIKSYIDLNYGEQDNYPLLCLPVSEPENVQLLVDSVEKLVPMGFKVKQSEIRDKLGLSDPELDEDGNSVDELFSNAAAPIEPAPVIAQNRAVAYNRAQSTTDEMAGLVDRLGSGVDQAVENWLTQVRTIIDQAIKDGSTLEDIQDVLLAQYGELDPSELAEAMGEAFSAAELAGRAEVADGN